MTSQSPGSNFRTRNGPPEPHGMGKNEENSPERAIGPTIDSSQEAKEKTLDKEVP